MSNVPKPPPDGNRGEGKDTVHVRACVRVCVQVNVCSAEIRGITPVWYRLVLSRAGAARAVGLRAMRGHGLWTKWSLPARMGAGACPLGLRIPLPPPSALEAVSSLRKPNRLCTNQNVSFRTRSMSGPLSWAVMLPQAPHL